MNLSLRVLSLIAIFWCALSEVRAHSSESLEMWRGRSADVIYVPSRSMHPGVSSIFAVFQAGALTSCKRLHLQEHLIGRTIARDIKLAQFPFRIDGRTGPYQTIIGVDVGGGERGLREAIAALSRALDQTSIPREIVSSEIAMMEIEGSVSHDGSAFPLMLLTDEGKDRLTKRCHIQTTDELRSMPAPTLVIFSGLSSKLVRKVASTSQFERPQNSSWHSVWLESSQKLDIPDNADLVVVPLPQPLSAEQWAGHKLLWQDVSDHLGEQLEVGLLGDQAIVVSGFRSHGVGISAAMVAIHEFAKRPPTSDGQTIRGRLCQNASMSEAILSRSFESISNASILADLKVHLSMCRGEGDEISLNAVASARTEAMKITLQRALATKTSKRRPRRQSLPFFDILACRPTIQERSDLDHYAALALQRQLGNFLRFERAVALHLTVALPETGDRCFLLRVEGAIVPQTQLYAAISEWMRRMKPPTMLRQTCFDALFLSRDKPAIQKLAGKGASACRERLEQSQFSKAMSALSVELKP